MTSWLTNFIQRQPHLEPEELEWTPAPAPFEPPRTILPVERACGQLSRSIEILQYDESMLSQEIAEKTEHLRQVRETLSAFRTAYHSLASDRSIVPDP